MDIALPKRKKITSLSFAHLINDWYMNYIQSLLPFLVISGLQVSRAAFLISAFTVTSSLLQPVFGYMVDKKNQRWMVYIGTVWMAVLTCLLGVIQNYGLLLAVAALAGLGTAAFHPQASALVSAVSGNKKGFFQACFTAAGNIGWALTPLMVVPFVQRYGLSKTPLFMLPGIFAAVLLWFSAPRLAVREEFSSSPLWPVLRESWRELSKLVVVVAFRSLAYFGLIAFLPLYLHKVNISLIIGSRLLFVMLFSGAMGGILGGFLSDHIGRKPVIAGSLIMASPLFYLFLNTSGLLSYVLLAMAGAALLASFSVTVVVAQEIISKNAAMASGLMLGFGLGVGGLGVGLVGLLADHLGLAFSVNLLIWLPLLAGLFALLMKVAKHLPAGLNE